jgi:hypothetical protein
MKMGAKVQLPAATRELSRPQVQINEQVIRELEVLGYKRDFIIMSLKMHDKNHCTTAYYLLEARARRTAELTKAISLD